MSATRLFVGNLPPNTNDIKLNETFSSYGKVANVDIKEKKGIDDTLSYFAFVTLETDTFNVNKCIADFSNNDWNGNYLNISIAKESFLERLKRERLEQEKLKSKQVDNNSSISNDREIHIEYKTPEPVVRSIDNSSAIQNNHDVFKKANEELRISSKKQDNHKKEKFNNVTPQYIAKPDRPEAIRKRKLIIASPFENSNTPVIEEKKSRPNDSVSDKKRIQSMQKMISSYNEKKSAIKIALSHVDKQVNNKIIFDDDDGSSKVVMKHSEKNGVCNVEGKDNKRNKESKIQKSTLFDDDSEDSEDEPSFAIKKQFEGESGQKLLELQSRFKSDKRFLMDERFLEETEKVEENTGDIIDSIEDNEKMRQMEILQNIVGGNLVKNNNTGEPNVAKKTAIKTMLRYDPTRTDHTKFINIPEKSDVAPKGKKDKKNKKDKLNETEVVLSNPAPEVSKERFYKIDDSLKQSMEEKAPFSLLSLFGNKDNEGKDINNDEYSSKTIKTKGKKTKEGLDGKSNPFFYDTSDTEDEKDDDKKDVAKNNNEILNNEFNTEAKVETIEENFFFANDDIRFAEGVEFFTKETQITNQSRTELKYIVKKRIHNNIRNEQFHSKKGNHNSFNSVKFKKR